MASEAADLQDQIDQIQGNDAAIENRRHDTKLADIKAEAEASGTESTLAYRNLVDLENKLHALKIANIQSEQKASGNTSSGTASSTASKPAGSSTSAPAAAPGAAVSSATPSGSISLQVAGVSHTINVYVSGGMIGTGTSDQVAESLARLVKPQLDAIAARSR